MVCLWPKRVDVKPWLMYTLARVSAVSREAAFPPYMTTHCSCFDHVLGRRYAMREALALVGDEGLEPMWKRHQRLHKDLWKGLGEMGLEPFVQNPADRLCTVNTIKVLVLVKS